MAIKSSAIVFVLAAIGWLISFYFHQVHHQRIKEGVWWMPRILRMKDCRCDEIVDSNFGSTFGHSNAFWGLWYYAFIAVAVVLSSYVGGVGLEYLFVITLLAFAYSIYLAWGLFLLRVVCRPCLGAHGVNLLIFAVLTYHSYPLLFAS